MNAQATGRRQLWLGLFLMALLALLVILQGAPVVARPYDLDSADATGLLGLRLWLQELGHPVVETAVETAVESTVGSATENATGNTEEETTFQLDPESRLLLIFPTSHPYNRARLTALTNWVAQGGTVIIMGNAMDDPLFIEQFGVQLTASTSTLLRVTAQQPFVPAPAHEIPLRGSLPVLSIDDAPQAVAVMANAANEITMAIQQYEAGEIWHWSAHHVPINEQLRDRAQAALMTMVLRDVPTGTPVQIDTYHLFGPPTIAAINTMQEWLYQTTIGQALLFLAGLTMVVLLLQGRRLGPPLPSIATMRRREAVEYVIAMGNLLRRARQRQSVANHHKRRLKRAVARRAHISADLDDDDFLRQLSIVRQGHRNNGSVTVDEADLRALFQTLDRAKDEPSLITAVTKIDELIAQMR